MFDAYTLRARLAPGVMAAVPAIILTGAGLTDLASGGSILAVIIGAFGMVICGKVRARGLAVQERLFTEWGGAPTTQLLRLRDSANYEQTRQRRQSSERATGMSLPSEADEANDPHAADQNIEAVVASLRVRAEPVSFPVLVAENTEYGFRRNSRGMREPALLIAGATLVTSVALLLLLDHGGRFAAASAVSAGALIFWPLVITDDWIRPAADKYAERLMLTAQSLPAA